MFCPHSVFMCFVWIWEQTAIISLYSINWLVCITETECLLRGTDWTFKCSSVWRSNIIPKATRQSVHLTTQERGQQFLKFSLSAGNKRMFTKGFLFVLKDSQSRMKYLKGFSCSKFVMFTVEDSSKFLTRHGSVIAMLHLLAPHPSPPQHHILYKQLLHKSLTSHLTNAHNPAASEWQRERQTNCCTRRGLSFNLTKNFECYNAKSQ